MRRTAFFCLVVASATASAHGFHTTLAELHWRPAQGRLEVSLLVADPDLREALRQARLGEALTDTAVATYLARSFVVTTGTIACPLRFAGRERERRGHWLHFEVLGITTPSQTTLSHQVLTNSEPFALHTVQLHRPGRSVVVETLEAGGEPWTLDLAAPSSVKER